MNRAPLATVRLKKGVFHGWTKNFVFDPIPPKAKVPKSQNQNWVFPLQSTPFGFDGTLYSHSKETSRLKDAAARRFTLLPSACTVPARVGSFQQRRTRVGNEYDGLSILVEGCGSLQKPVR